MGQVPTNDELQSMSNSNPAFIIPYFTRFPSDYYCDPLARTHGNHELSCQNVFNDQPVVVVSPLSPLSLQPPASPWHHSLRQHLVSKLLQFQNGQSVRKGENPSKKRPPETVAPYIICISRAIIWLALNGSRIGSHSSGYTLLDVEVNVRG